MHTRLVLDAREQTLRERAARDGLIPHSDRGTRYLSVFYTDRMQEAGVEGTDGSTGDSYDNALFVTLHIEIAPISIVATELEDDTHRPEKRQPINSA